MRGVAIILCVVVAALCLHAELASAATEVTVQIEPRTTECYYEDLEEGEEMAIYYQVLRGGLLDIKFQVYFEPKDGRPPSVITDILHFEDEGDGYIDILAEADGLHKFCFNNEMSRWTAKVVTFTIEYENDWDNSQADSSDQEKSDLAKSEHIDPMEQSLERIAQQVHKLTKHQMYLKGNEFQMRDLVEETNSRVWMLSMLESIVLVTISLAQVFYLRRFFEARTKTRV
eukprot:TRINITY_DN8658_c0_g1_i1.p1 TRINITY_DN8658_c0_g1~~TRINITY_DN8658_c0_g1_i1.p1  ORF type:complete len:229 (-),score=64.26 TRINITY_DN8658_c0_g1_i1:66-752(-)